MTFKTNMALKPLLIICLLLLPFINCEIDYSAEISTVLNHLNSSAIKLYNYKEATLLKAHTKCNITELSLDVAVDCTNEYPEITCNEKVLNCHTFVQKNDVGDYHVVNDVNCQPKPELLVEQTTVEDTSQFSHLTGSVVEPKVDNEAASSEFSEPFVAIRKDTVPCLGCPFDLNPNVEGIDELVDLGLEHVGSEKQKRPNLVKVLRLQQQVVAGIKYILTAEFGTAEENYICRITYIQKPWISLEKHIIANNCTTSQEYTKKTEINNEVTDTRDISRNKSPNFNEIAENGNFEEISPLRLTDLESQIIPDDLLKRQKRAIPQLEKISVDEKNLVKNLADFAASALDNIDDDNNRRVILQILGAKKMVSDDGVYYHLILRMGVSECIEDKPIMPHENCREKLFENYTKICKVQIFVNEEYGSPRVVKSQCQNIKKDKNNSNRTNYSRFKRHMLVGGHSPIDKNSQKVTELVKEAIQHYTNNYNSNNNASKNFELESVTSATQQVVAGLSYNIEVVLLESSNTQICRFKIWEKLWMDFRQFTLRCEGDTKPFVIETTIKRQKRQISNSDDYVDKYLEECLKRLDSESKYNNKLKIDQIISVDKNSVVPLFSYFFKIKAKIVLTDCDKNTTLSRNDCGVEQSSANQICFFRIYKMLWLPNSHITIECQSDNHFDTYLVMFSKFITTYNKTYSTDEFKERFRIFQENLFQITLLNSHEKGTAKYGVTKFADLSRVEFSRLLGFRRDLRNDNEAPFAVAETPDIDLPVEFDWRTHKAVSEVKDQGQCGSCWAFSVTGNVEGQYAIKHGELLEFSEQELVDCDTDDQGCNGGLMDNAYRQIEKLGGLESEKDYPYDAEDEKCKFNRSLAEVQLSGAVNISHDEIDMAKWLVANGPISIAINANAMQFYMGGISHPFRFLCSPDNLDHGVLIVGYGIRTYQLFNKTYPYWIVKNSWGKNWGEQGYYRVFRGDGTCGLNQTPSSAIVV